MLTRVLMTEQEEITRLKKVALEAGKQLVDAQAPLLQLRSQRSTLEGEKRDKTGELLGDFEMCERQDRDPLLVDFGDV